jgi:hypothetical protein
MTFTLLSVVILGITAAIVYVQAKAGYKKGLSVSLVNLAITFTSVILGVLFSLLIASPCGDLVFLLLSRVKVYQTLMSKLGLIEPLCEVLVKVLLALLIYVPIFLSIRAIIKFIIGIIIRANRKKTPKHVMEYFPENEDYLDKYNKGMGAAVGALTGVLIAIAVLMPVTGLLNTAGDVVDILETSTSKVVTKNSKTIALVDKYSDDFAGTLLNACGGKALYDMTTTISVSGQTTCLSREVDIISSIDIMDLRNSLVAKGAITPDNINKAEGLLMTISDSVALKLISAEFLNNAATKWLEGEKYMGIKKPSLGGHSALDGFMDSVLYVCSTSTFDTIDADINTIVTLIKTFQEYTALSKSGDYTTFMKEFVAQNGLQRIEDELYKNPHMSTVHVAIENLIMNVVAQELESAPIYTDAIKSKLYKELASALQDAQGLTGSVKLLAISNGVSEHFGDTGMYIPENLNEKMADILDKNVAAMGGTITEEDVKSFFDQYIPK